MTAKMVIIIDLLLSQFCYVNVNFIFKRRILTVWPSQKTLIFQETYWNKNLFKSRLTTNEQNIKIEFSWTCCQDFYLLTIKSMKNSLIVL